MGSCYGARRSGFVEIEGIFPKEASKLIKLASEKRENADYLDFFVASKEEAEEQLERAETFGKWIEEYLKAKII
ncbi:MAG: HEPN domain-containing protein [Clostridium sp.]|nr:HEPN domain-containing protein [Clostridium sp.]